MAEDLLTPAEHRVVDMLADAWNLYIREVVGDEDPRDDDLAEFASRVHDLQFRVLANAAARAYPERYRLQGGRRMAATVDPTPVQAPYAAPDTTFCPACGRTSEEYVGHVSRIPVHGARCVHPFHYTDLCGATSPNDPDLRCTQPAGHGPVRRPGDSTEWDHADFAHSAGWMDPHCRSENSGHPCQHRRSHDGLHRDGRFVWEADPTDTEDDGDPTLYWRPDGYDGGRGVPLYRVSPCDAVAQGTAHTPHPTRRWHLYCEGYAP